MLSIGTNWARTVFLVLTGAVIAVGQPQLEYKAVIPFAFKVPRGATLAAGTYLFSYTTGSHVVTLTDSASKKFVLPVITQMAGQARFGDADLVFDDSGNAPVISEIWIPGRDGILVYSTKGSHSHRSVLAVVSGQTTGSGKEMFARSCAKCHGVNGTGNEAADRFFNTAIPRLASATVQAKSDFELKEIITQGRRGMEPVRLEEGGVRHLLQPESVDRLIAYVRTLRE